jgi:hypothetical protein
MASQDSQLTRHDPEAKIVKRCWENEGFRAEFIADPEGVFVKYLEVPAASLPKVVVHEEAAGSWRIVLPARPVKAGELSEAELERIAGGATPPVVSVRTAVVVFGLPIGITVYDAVTNREYHGW